MALLKLQWRNLDSFESTVIWDGVPYIIERSWNSSFEYWYLSVFDIEENPLLQHKKIMPNNELFERYHADPNFPAGNLYCYKHNLSNGRLEKKDFINNVASLIYEEKEIVQEDDPGTGNIIPLVVP